MFLQSLSLVNFKNYRQVDLNFTPKINGFVGNNGVGKTNLLDAIYHLSFCKSYFNAIDSQNINHDSPFYVIEGMFSRQDKDEKIYCGLKRNRKKKFKRNRKEYQKLSQHIGLLPLVMISPLDSNLISGGSDERRKFIDSVISQYDKKYLGDLIKYNRTLAQRNQLLKNFAKDNRFDASMLDIYDEQLVELGQNIHALRVEFISKLLPVFQKYYNFISKNKEDVQLMYQSHLNENDFKTALTNAQKKDRILQYTSVGIHRDDLMLQIKNYPIKKTGSQGQQKTYLLALKLAQFDFIKEINGFKPILLFDDIFDKLDAERVEQIVRLVSDHHFGQIFITDTSQNRLKEILSKTTIEYKIFKIANDEIV